MNRYKHRISTPAGDMEATLSGNGVHALTFAEVGTPAIQPGPVPDEDDEAKRVAGQLAVQLEEWFLGIRREFELPLDVEGTEFQRQVWDQLRKIPYGETRSYSQVADQLARPRSVRPVAAAIGKNPVPVLVPCHRVIGKDGSLTGYNGGIRRKSWLLAHERKISGLGGGSQMA